MSATGIPIGPIVDFGLNIATSIIGLKKAAKLKPPMRYVAADPDDLVEHTRWLAETAKWEARPFCGRTGQGIFQIPQIIDGEPHIRKIKPRGQFGSSMVPCRYQIPSSRARVMFADQIDVTTRGRFPVDTSLHSLVESVKQGPQTWWTVAEADRAELLGVHPSRLPESPYFSRYGSAVLPRQLRPAMGWGRNKGSAMESGILGADVSTAGGVPFIQPHSSSGFLWTGPSAGFYLIETIADPGHPAFDAPTQIPKVNELMRWQPGVLVHPDENNPNVNLTIPANYEQAAADRWKVSRNLGHEVRAYTGVEPFAATGMDFGALPLGDIIPSDWIPPAYGFAGSYGSARSVVTTAREIAIADITTRDFSAFPDPEFERMSQLWYVDNRPDFAENLADQVLERAGEAPRYARTEDFGGDILPTWSTAVGEPEFGVYPEVTQLSVSEQMRIDVARARALQAELAAAPIEPTYRFPQETERQPGYAPVDPEAQRVADLQAGDRAERAAREGAPPPFSATPQEAPPMAGWFDQIVTSIPQLAQTAINLNQAFNPAMQPRMVNYPVAGVPYGPIPQQMAQEQINADPTGRYTQPGGSLVQWSQSAAPAGIPGIAPAMYSPELGSMGDVLTPDAIFPPSISGKSLAPFSRTASGNFRTNSLIAAPDWKGDLRYWVGGVKLSTRWIKDKVLHDSRRRKRCPR